MGSSNEKPKFEKYVSIEELKKMVEKNSDLKNYIDIEYLTSKRGEALLAYLSKIDYNEVTNINFMDVSIEDKGMLFLSLCHFKKITELFFPDNDITDKGLEYFSHGNYETVVGLNFSFNKITEEGLKFLCNSNCKNLASIILRNNNIKDQEVAKELLEKHFPKLTKIAM